MSKKVVKRNGDVVDFDLSKIRTALAKALKEVYGEELAGNGGLDHYTSLIIDRLDLDNQEMSVEEIQDEVETALMESELFDVAKAYIRYRYDREKDREVKNDFDRRFEQFSSLIKGENEEATKENSNKDTRVLSVMRDYIAGFTCKEMAKAILPKDVMDAHLNGIIHFHDQDYSPAMPMSNCELINLEDMLQNGTVLNGTMIEKPKSFKTACTVTSQISAQVCSVTYGGQSINLAHLAPFVDVSRQKHLRETRADFEKSGLTLDEKSIFKVANERLKREIKDGIQTLQYEWITLNGTNGQAAFVTLFMYINDVAEGQLRDDLVLLIEEVLRQRIVGVKNSKGAYITIAFPKLIYVLDENNIYEDSEYWWLTKLAAECSTKRLVPDYVSAKRMKELKEGNVFAPMGCVSGCEPITYKIGDQIYKVEFQKAWDHLSQKFEVKVQPDQMNVYMDLEGVEIYDTLEGFVPCYRMIRNQSNAWVEVFFDNEDLIDATLDHPFEVIGKGVVYGDDLTVGDQMYATIDGKVSVVKVVDILRCFFDSFSYDVTTASEHFEVAGIYSHNCRSFLSPWKDDEGNYKFWGRFNQGVVSLNLPHVALSSKGDMNEFWRILDERLQLCFKALIARHNSLKGIKAKVAPIMWMNGAVARLDADDVIDPLLYGGYSTISLGYAGIYEMTRYMTGESNTSPKGHDFALQVMKYLEETTKRWKQETNIGFALYGTPLENTTEKFAKVNERDFGIIKDVTDHGYVTNSYHVNPHEQINAFDKLSFESEFQDLSLGGAISYVETPNMTKNIDAVLEVMKHIYETNMYAEINTTTSYCHICGCTDIKMEDDLKYHCPNCGNDDFNKMNIAVRVCGYVSTNPFNDGRAKDIYDRVYHIGD